MSLYHGEPPHGRRKRIGYAIDKLPVKSSSLKPRAHESECVASLTYDPERLEATCNFVNRGSYAYFDVEVGVFAEWNNANSRGQYFNEYIRGRYEYEKV